MVREVDYKTRPIDGDFIDRTAEYPETGHHEGHIVRAEGKERPDGDGNPYPTQLGIHGTHVAVDFESCIADGVCMDVCPVDVFEWYHNPGEMGTGKDRVLEKGSDLWKQFRTDKSDPIREEDCIDCMACEASCPTEAIKIIIA
ncbi:MAG: 4Fe-4S binding protein [Thermoplasmata archaeon]